MRSLLAVVAPALATACSSDLPVECTRSEGCDEAAEAATDLLRGEKGEMPESLRAHHTGERAWFVVACWPEGRYVTVKVALDSTPQATFGGALFGVQPCA